MEMIFYTLALLGSSSLGYSIIRTGFPNTQKLETMMKVLYGYLIGLSVILPGIAAAFLFGVGGFFLIAGLLYGLLFIVMIAKRISYDDKDSVELIHEEKKRVIPKKILTVGEKENKTIIPKNIKKVPIINKQKVKEQLFKEKQPSVITQLRKKTIEIQDKKAEKDRNEALKKMKAFAKQINKKKNKEDIDEEELETIGEDF